MRNWLIGAYIAEYELQGTDCAAYGDKLFTELAEHLGQLKVSNCSRRQLYRYLRFYRVYPEIVGTLSPQLQEKLPCALPLQAPDEDKKVGTPSAQLGPHQTKRALYEIECLRGNWSVRELKHQIASLYYKRSGLSRDKKRLAELVRSGAEQAEPRLAIRDPYVFEFLGLKPAEVVSESNLEAQLLDKLQELLLELGHGFCFEARQK